MARAIIIVTQGDAEFIGACEYVDGRHVIDGDGYLALHDPLRLGVRTTGGNFATVMYPYGSLDWVTKTRFYRPSITDAGPIAAARYTQMVEEYKKEFEKQQSRAEKKAEKKDPIVHTPTLIIGGKR